MPKEGSHCICPLVVLIDCGFKMGQNYYPHVLLEEYKYVVNKNEVTRHFTEDFNISSDSDEFDTK